MFDAHANLAYSLVVTAPSPPTSGTTLTVSAGQGALFPAAPFNCTVWPAGVQPLTTNAEIVRVTNIATDTFTITRAQESTTAMPIAAGYQIANTATAKVFTDIEAATGGGSGNVTGPASAVSGNFADFGDTTGKLIADSGKNASSFDAAGAAAAAQAAAEAASDPVGSAATAQSNAEAYTAAQIAALTPTSVGLGNVTNDVQTKNAIVPNTAPTAGQIPVGNAGNTAYAPKTVSGDATLASTGALTVVGFNGSNLSTTTGGGTFTAASYNALPVITLAFKTVAIQTSGSAQDLCFINIPAGITRFRVAGGSTALGNCVIGESAANLSGAAFTLFTAASGGGTQVSSTGFLGPNGAVAVNITATSSTSVISGATTIYIRQTANSANTGNASFYLTIAVMN